MEYNLNVGDLTGELIISYCGDSHFSDVDPVAHRPHCIPEDAWCPSLSEAATITGCISRPTPGGISNIQCPE